MPPAQRSTMNPRLSNRMAAAHHAITPALEDANRLKQSFDHCLHYSLQRLFLIQVVLNLSSLSCSPEKAPSLVTPASNTRIKAPGSATHQANFRSIANVMAGWREPVNLEVPWNIDGIAQSGVLLWIPSTQVNLHLAYQNASTMSEGLEAVLKEYNQNQRRYPSSAHITYTAKTLGSHTTLVPSQVWSGKDWIPAENTLDKAITLQVQTNCIDAVQRIVDVVQHEYPNQGPIFGGISSYYLRALGTSESDLNCVLTGEKPAREHLHEILDQLEVQTGEPWLYQLHAWMLPADSPNCSPSALCHRETLSIQPLFELEKRFESYAFERDKYYRMPYFQVRDPKRPPSPYPSRVPVGKLPDDWMAEEDTASEAQAAKRTPEK